MLHLADFDNISTPMVDLYDQFTMAVLKDIARRLAKMGGATSSAAWQVERLLQSGKTYDYVLKELARISGRSNAVLREEFNKYAVKSVKYDNRILVQAGVLPAEYANLSPAMLNVLEAGLRKTQGLLNNMTMTTANTSQVAFLEAADLAYMLVSHGAMSYNQAIRAAIKDVAAKGLKVIQYPSGRKDQLDVAMRRAVLTGVSQTAAEVSMKNLNEVGVGYIAVSAHIGARNKGDLPENHEMWQGRIYSTNGDPKYPDFLTWTGYGTGEGLCGWNCRHSFYPYFEGISEQFYTPAMLKEYANKTVNYRGQTLSFYEATQVQRGIERDIRKAKRVAESLAEAGLDNQQEMAEVRTLQAEMRNFVRQTTLHRQPEREGGHVPLVKILPEKPKMPQVSVRPVPVVPVVTKMPPKQPSKMPSPAFPTVIPAGAKPWMSVAGGMESAVKNGYTVDEDPNRNHGIFESIKVRLSTDDFAIMKPNTDSMSKASLSKREALAYDIDQALGLGIVPETYYSPVPLAVSDGASFQLFVDAELGRNATELRHAEEIAKMDLLDALIGNSDRHGGNWMVKDGHLIAIDHGLSFSWRSDQSSIVEWIVEHYEMKLVYRGKETVLGPAHSNVPMPISNEVFARLEYMVTSGWLDDFGLGTLNDQEREAIKIRGQWLLDHWDEYFKEP
jgi:hypothetical protein